MADGKISSIKFVIPSDGTDFGLAIPFEIHTDNIQDGTRLDLRLCNSYRNIKGDAGGNISVTVKNGIARGTCRVPLHQEWENDPLEKSKRPLVEYWYVGTIAFESKEFAGERIKVPTKETRQDFVFQHIASSSNRPRIMLKGDCLKLPVVVDSTKTINFHTTKSATDTFNLHFHDDRMLYGKPFVLPLSEKLLEKGDPICVLHSQFGNGTIGDFLGVSSAPASTTFVSIKPGLKPVLLPGGMKEEDPIIVMDLKGNASVAGLKQGKNSLGETSDWGKRILHETIYGSDVVPSAVAIKESYPLLKDFIKGGTFYIKTVKGRDYVIFKGWPALRHIYKGSRYWLDNAKVVNLAAAKGAGSAIKSAFTMSEGSALSLIFCLFYGYCRVDGKG